jgi:hypothetical protein
MRGIQLDHFVVAGPLVSDDPLDIHDMAAMDADKPVLVESCGVVARDFTRRAAAALAASVALAAAWDSAEQLSWLITLRVTVDLVE